MLVMADFDCVFVRTAGVAVVLSTDKQCLDEDQSGTAVSALPVETLRGLFL